MAGLASTPRREVGSGRCSLSGRARRSVEHGSLSPDEVRSLLACGGPGRIGASINALPAVVPTNYLYFGGSLICASDDELVVHAAEHTAILALSADRTDACGLWQWHVHVVGKSEMVTDDQTRSELAMLGLLSPSGQTPSQCIRLHPDILTGFHFVSAGSPAPGGS